jgi:hypothetical protein
MSMDASGTVAGAIVFSRWKGLPYVRRHAIPSNPRSPKQVSMRAMMSFLAREWTPHIVPAGSPAWDTLAETMHQSGFNRFIAVNQSRWRTFKTPTMVYPAAEISTPPTAPTLTVTGGVREATVDIDIQTNLPDWGVVIFAANGSAPTPSISSLVGVIYQYTGTGKFVHTPIGPGTWHYKAAGFMADGVTGAMSADASDQVL